MDNVTQMNNDVKNPEQIALIGELQNTIAKFDNLTELDIIAALEIVKTEYCMAPYIRALKSNK